MKIKVTYEDHDYDRARTALATIEDAIKRSGVIVTITERQEWSASSDGKIHTRGFQLSDETA